MHFDCEAHLKLLKLHKNIGQAVACQYLHLGLTAGISLLFRNETKMHALSHDSRFTQSDDFLYEKHISVTIKYTIVSWFN